MDISERIKSRRKQLGLTADFIADALNVARSTYYRYESKDIEKMPITVIEPLAKVLRITPMQLMGWDDDQGIDLVYQDKDFYLHSDTRQVVDGADTFLRKSLLSMTEEKPPTREYMITWLNENMIRYASSGGVNYEQMNDDELRGYYESAKEKIEGD